MAIVINGSNKGNFIANNKQLQKVYANGVLVWENWKPWSNSNSTYKDNYPSSPIYATISAGSNVVVKYIKATAEKAFYDGEYGAVHIEAYYDGAWHELAHSDGSMSYCECSWSGELVCEQIRANFGFQVYRWAKCAIEASGLTKGN